jgi:hypothetical protein
MEDGRGGTPEFGPPEGLVAVPNDPHRLRVRASRPGSPCDPQDQHLPPKGLSYSRANFRR